MIHSGPRSSVMLHGFLNLSWSIEQNHSRRSKNFHLQIWNFQRLCALSHSWHDWHSISYLKYLRTFEIPINLLIDRSSSSSFDTAGAARHVSNTRRQERNIRNVNSNSYLTRNNLTILLATTLSVGSVSSRKKISSLCIHCLFRSRKWHHNSFYWSKSLNSFIYTGKDWFTICCIIINLSGCFFVVRVSIPRSRWYFTSRALNDRKIYDLFELHLHCLCSCWNILIDTQCSLLNSEKMRHSKCK